MKFALTQAFIKNFFLENDTHMYVHADTCLSNTKLDLENQNQQSLLFIFLITTLYEETTIC